MTEKTYEAADSLTHYLQEIRRFPMLSADEELKLIEHWRESEDQEALQRLVGSHLRLVVKIARGFSGYGLPLNDLVSQGHVGLMQAVEKYDPERGVRFATYAIWWIRAAIQEYLLRSWSLVKMGTTASQKKLFFNLRRLKSRLQDFDQTELSPEAVASIAAELDVPEQDVRDMNGRMSARDQSLNTPLTTESYEQGQDFLVEDSPDQEAQLISRDENAWRRKSLRQGLAKLNDRERRILEKRRLQETPITLDVLGQEYGISRERVRQIENRAYEKLRAEVHRSIVRDNLEKQEKRARWKNYNSGERGVPPKGKPDLQCLQPSL